MRTTETPKEPSQHKRLSEYPNDAGASRELVNWTAGTNVTTVLVFDTLQVRSGVIW